MSLCLAQQNDLISTDSYWGLFLKSTPKYTCEMLYIDKESDDKLIEFAMGASEESLREEWDTPENKYWDTL